MDIVETRRENLRRWVAEYGTPSKEKSLFSQLKSNGSFGERVARRLEDQYRMGAGYLDRPVFGLPPEQGDDGFIMDAPPFLIDGARGVRPGAGPTTVLVKAVTLRLQAGVSGFIAEPDLDIDGGLFGVPTEVIEQLKTDPRDLMIMPVKGRSMEPMMFEDDRVLVDTTRRKPVDRECFAINWNGELVVKMLIKKSDGWYLYSLNREPEFHTISVRSGQCSIIGMVVWQPSRMVKGRL